jgi:excisionase family DNA binding protein
MSTESPFVTIEEVAKHFAVSVATVRKWVKSGTIPKNTYLKIGNTYRFHLQDVTAALTGRPVQLELDLEPEQ